jgi:error-prone DNA polymerase
MSYVELHARTAFSFLEGASSPEEMATVCAGQGLGAMAVMDRDGVYGAPRFHLSAKREGVCAHIGADLTVNPPRRHGGTEKFRVSGFEFREEQGLKPGNILAGDSARLKPCPDTKPYLDTNLQGDGNADASNRDSATDNFEIRNHQSEISSVSPCLRGGFVLPLLAQNRTGYQNLCRVVTRMKLRAAKHAQPGEIATSYEELAEFAPGLICLTGGDDGPLACAMERGGAEEGRREVERLAALFGRENVYVELQRHFLREEEARNQAAVEMARALGLPLIATNGVRYAQRAQRQVLDVFTSIHNHRTLDTAGRLLARNSERHIKPPKEMARLFADLPEAIANTVELSSRLGFTMEDLGYQFPRYPVPEGETMNSFLRKRTFEGAQGRYGRAPADLRRRAWRQLERELALIEKLELAGYFLIVWDIVRFCRGEGILVQGRGSAANSAVCYSLGITAVDPVGMDLLFERFLSEERGEWPDIDLDLPSGEERERAIQYVYQRYGKLGAAMTANVITYRGRSAAREIGKTLSFDNDTIDRLAKLVGHWEYRDPGETLARQFGDAGFDLRHPRIRRFFDLVLAVQDLPRHLGQHSGGMVICQGQLDSVVPLERASMPGRVVVQWDKDDCADMGIIKVDLLGLGMMAVLEECLELIPRHYGEPVDLARLPADDPATYAAIQKADTVGMFQIESRAQMSCLPRMRPQKFYDLVVQVALIRPGPIVGKMVNPYLKRRQGREAVSYPHPALEPVLARTLGVPLFQEQLLRIAMITAGFSGGEAEELRRAFGFKRSEKRMMDIEKKLRAGMTRNGLAAQAQDEVIHAITSFALYGFPESHAASFALLAYASAYLKTHYLAAFTAAMLNNQPMGFYHSSTLVKDAQRHGLKIKCADVAVSEWLCTIAKDDSPQRHRDTEKKSEINSSVPLCLCGGKDLSVRLGLRYVRGLREETARALLAARAEQPFASIADLARRVPELSKRELQTLADIGALNSLMSMAESRGPRADGSSESPPVIDHRPATFAELQPTLPSIAAQLQRPHRRAALWQVEKAVRHPGPLLKELEEEEGLSPLKKMSTQERLSADFRGTGLTVGPHPMAYRRAALDRQGVRRACELEHLPDGKNVKVAGCVICRQRPGTAHGFVFLSLEDESGIVNVIVMPDLFDRHRLLLVGEHYLLVEGRLQNLDNVISVRAERIRALRVSWARIASHDFH